MGEWEVAQREAVEREVSENGIVKWEVLEGDKVQKEVLGGRWFSCRCLREKDIRANLRATRVNQSKKEKIHLSPEILFFFLRCVV